MEAKEGILLDREGTPISGQGSKPQALLRVWHFPRWLTPIVFGIGAPLLMMMGFAALGILATAFFILMIFRAIFGGSFSRSSQIRFYRR